MTTNAHLESGDIEGIPTDIAGGALSVTEIVGGNQQRIDLDDECGL